MACVRQVIVTITPNGGTWLVRGRLLSQPHQMVVHGLWEAGYCHSHTKYWYMACVRQVIVTATPNGGSWLVWGRLLSQPHQMVVSGLWEASRWLSQPYMVIRGLWEAGSLLAHPPTGSTWLVRGRLYCHSHTKWWYMICERQMVYWYNHLW